MENIMMFSKKNFLRVRLRGLIAVWAITVAAVLGGGAYAIAIATVTASATDTVVTSTTNTNLSPTGGVPTTILSLTLPGSSTKASSYVLSAYGDLVNFGPSDYTRCAIRVNGSLVAAVAILVGDPSASGNQGPAGLLSPFALAGGITVPAGTTSENATFYCAHDNTNGSTPYVDASASFVAHRTGSLKVATEP
jgi:hypothetical protein